MTEIQQIVNHYFYTKGYTLEEVKEYSKTGEIKYARYVRSAKQLLELTDTVENAKKELDKISTWANDNGLEYSIETVIKRYWL